MTKWLVVPFCSNTVDPPIVVPYSTLFQFCIEPVFTVESVPLSWKDGGVVVRGGGEKEREEEHAGPH